MKECYREKNFRKASMQLITYCDAVIKKYAAQRLKLTK